jgi:hypothetical protein
MARCDGRLQGARCEVRAALPALGLALSCAGLLHSCRCTILFKRGALWVILVGGTLLEFTSLVIGVEFSKRWGIRC